MFLALERIILLGWEKFSRDKSSTWAALIVTAVVVFMFSSLLFLQGVSVFLLSRLENSVDVSVYFAQDASEEDILAFKERLLPVPEVKDAVYISKDKALEEFVALHKNDQFIVDALETIGTNPLLASLNILAKDPGQYPKIAQFLEQEAFSGIVERVDYKDRQNVIQRMEELTKGIRLVVLIVSVGLAFIAVLVAFNTIRLTIYNSRDEIEVMRLVGASNSFIQGPFVVQGIVVGVFGGLLTFLFLFFLSWFAGPRFESFLSGFNLFEYFTSHVFLFLALEFGVGIGLGVVSSVVAIQKYLRI
ncbi:MAG: cell division protein [Parcubacteria group bacterium Greene0714_21]|nr:MAG: cell division protein [Parcubacteria group bacterium Greene0416_39]TSC97929.1 MAG: cell division protein [Parcubacteria group bacterium Greene1014_47]TSD04555.1 MAG: cell division protein [Parcubacteria group bacterium Greene0714_21]